MELIGLELLIVVGGLYIYKNVCLFLRSLFVKVVIWLVCKFEKLLNDIMSIECLGCKLSYFRYLVVFFWLDFEIFELFLKYIVGRRGLIVKILCFFCIVLISMCIREGFYFN